MRLFFRCGPVMARISILPDCQVKPLLTAYNQTLMKKRRNQGLFFLTIVVLAFVFSIIAEIQPVLLADQIGGFTSYVERITPSLSAATLPRDIGLWYWDIGHWLNLLFETALIAYLATLFGGIGAFFLSFLAVRALSPSPVVCFFAKRALEFFRTVPEVVMALLFVIAFGVGPMAGVMALSIHTMGTLGKLFSEVAENIDMAPVEAARASGASRMQAVRFAVLPQVLPNFASYALLRFEINVRGASVMGLVGAGGIGQDLVVAIRQFYYSDVSAILILIVLTVMLIDAVTERVHHRLIGFNRRAS